MCWGRCTGAAFVADAGPFPKHAVVSHSVAQACVACMHWWTRSRSAMFFHWLNSRTSCIMDDTPWPAVALTSVHVSVAWTRYAHDASRTALRNTCAELVNTCRTGSVETGTRPRYPSRCSEDNVVDTRMVFPWVPSRKPMVPGTGSATKGL